MRKQLDLVIAVLMIACGVVALVKHAETAPLFFAVGGLYLRNDGRRL